MTSIAETVDANSMVVSAMPLPGILLLAWAIGLLVAIVTLPVGIMRLRRGLSVIRIIALSRVTVFGTALASLCTIIGLFSSLIPMGAISLAPILTEETVIGLKQLLGIMNTSLFICGVNGLIAFALSQKWKDPQQSPSPYSSPAAGSESGEA